VDFLQHCLPLLDTARRKPLPPLGQKRQEGLKRAPCKDRTLPQIAPRVERFEKGGLLLHFSKQGSAVRGAIFKAAE
jgi:hypothetical protein